MATGHVIDKRDPLASVPRSKWPVFADGQKDINIKNKQEAVGVYKRKRFITACRFPPFPGEFGAMRVCFAI